MLGTPPAFILSQDQTLEIFYIQSFRTTYQFFRASVLLFYFFVRVLFSLWNREFLALQFTISCLLLYFVLSLALIYLYMMCCSIFKDQILGGLIVFRAALLADSLYIIPLVFTFVNRFFKTFLSFFKLFSSPSTLDKRSDYF